MVQCVNSKVSVERLHNTSNPLCDPISTPMQHGFLVNFIYHNVDHCFGSHQPEVSPSLGVSMLTHYVNTIVGDLTLYDSHVDSHNGSSYYAARSVNNIFQC